jgi:S1-C subfamily serine protease
MTLSFSFRLALAGLVIATAADAQRAVQCAAVNAQPDFGYDGIECVNCEINGMNQPWIVFHAEPRIRNVRAGGPADGRLREGDTLAEIDGIAITRRAAAEWYARVPAGDTVVLTVKRDGGPVKVPIVTGRKCVINQSFSAGDMPRFQWNLKSANGTWTMSTGKKLRFAPNAGNWFKFSKLDSTIRWTTAFPAARKAGWLGIGIVRRYVIIDSIKVPEEFERPFPQVPEVAVVAPAGPAAIAGIEPGDTLLAVDGMSLLSPAGAERFRHPPVGASLLLTLRRGGSQRDIRVVASALPAGPPAQ